MSPDDIFEVKKHYTAVEVWLKFAPDLEHEWESDEPWWLEAEVYAKGKLWEKYGEEIIAYIQSGKEVKP